MHTDHLLSTFTVKTRQSVGLVRVWKTVPLWLKGTYVQSS